MQTRTRTRKSHVFHDPLPRGYAAPTGDFLTPPEKTSARQYQTRQASTGDGVEIGGRMGTDGSGWVERSDGQRLLAENRCAAFFVSPVSPDSETRIAAAAWAPGVGRPPLLHGQVSGSRVERRSPFPSVNRNEIANICDGQQKDDSCGCGPVHDGVFSPKRRRPAAKPHPKQ